MTDKPSKKANYNDILASVAELNKQQIIDIYVPSINDNVKFKPLTVKQQKRILSSGLDMELEKLSFSNTINELITENCLAGANNIRITDKPMIMLQLRQRAIGDKLTVTEGDSKFEIDLSEHIEVVKNKLNTQINPQFNVELQGVTITGETPDLKTDTKFNKLFAKTVKRGKSGELSLNDLVGDIYVHEMVKYVKSITINEIELAIDESITADQVIKVFESLPMQISSKVTQEIKKLRENEIISISHDSLPVDTQITLDVSLFTDE